ncbi:MAG: STAS domain-containing protein [Leptospirales bacterium]|jgi:anti-anti-sigma factor
MADVDFKLKDGIYILRPTATRDLSLQLTRDDLTGLIKKNVKRLPTLVDLGQVRILQSAGVGLLFFFLIEAQKAGIRVGFFNTSELVMKVLDIAGVQDIAKVYGNAQEARQDLA